MSFPFFPLTALKTLTVPVVKRAMSGAMAVASTVPLSLFVSGGIANAYTFPAPTNTYYQRFISATNGRLTAYDFQVVACNYYSNAPGAYVGGNSLCNILTAQPGYWDTNQILYYRLYDCSASISESKIFVNFYGLQNQPRASFLLATDANGKVLDSTNPGVPITANVNACGSPVSSFTYPSWFTPGATSEKSIWFFPAQNTARWTKPTDNRSQSVAFFTYRTGDLSQPLTVNLATGGTAQSGVDFDWSDPFNPAPGTPFGQLYFAPGRAVTNSILYARTVSQTTPEQTVTLQMAIPTGYVSGGLDTFIGVFGPVTVPVVSVGNAGSSLTLTPGSTTEGFVITRSGNIDQPLTVTYALAGTAQNGTDYSYLDGNLLFAANQTSVAIPITITPPSGSASVPSKTVSVTLQPGSTPGENQYNTTGGTTLNYTIPAYTPSQVTISQPTSTTLQPGQSSSFTVTRTGDTTNPMTVPYTLGGTAQNGTDYQALPGSVTIPAGQTTATIPINTTPQTGSTAVPQKTITVTPQAGAGYTTTGTPATYTISAYTPSQVTISQPSSTTLQPGQSSSFTVTRTGNTTNPMAVSYTLAGTAQNGTDYQALPGNVTIPAGQTAVTVPINTTPQTGSTAVPQKTITVTPQVGAGYTTTGTPATYTIAPYAPQSVTVAPTSAGGGTIARPGTGSFTVTRPGTDTSQPLTIAYTTSGTAQSGTDYQALPGTVTIPAGQTTAQVPINVPSPSATTMPQRDLTVTLQ